MASEPLLATTRTRLAALIEVYLPTADGRRVEEALAAAVREADRAVVVGGGSQLVAGAFLPDEELLLLLFETDSPAGTQQLLEAAGIAPLRIASCRRIVIGPDQIASPDARRGKPR
jgi:hypothetical protein